MRMMQQSRLEWNRRRGAALLEYWILGASVFFIGMLYASIYIAAWLRQAKAVTKSLEAGRAVEATHVHFGRDYERLMDREESFPWLYDLNESDGQGPGGRIAGGVRLRDEAGNLLVVEAVDGFLDQYIIPTSLSTQYGKQERFWGESFELDNTAYARATALNSMVFLESDLKGQFKTTTGGGEATAVAGKDRVGIEASRAFTWLEMEGDASLLGKKASIHMRIGGADCEALLGNTKDEQDRFSGGRILGSLSAFEFEIRKRLAGEKGKDEDGYLDVFAGLKIASAEMSGTLGHGQFEKKTPGQTSGTTHVGTGVDARLEFVLAQAAIGLDAALPEFQIPYTDTKVQVVGSVDLTGKFATGASIKGVIEQAEGEYRWKQGISKALGAGGEFNYEIGVKIR